MAAINFEAAMRRLLAHEGGYVNHPSDPGGPTHHGITLATYRQFARPDATAADVRRMTVAEARAIYRARYWHAVRCDQLPAGVDYAAFDYAVNSGPARVVRVLRRLVGLPPDGIIDDALLTRLHARERAGLIGALCDERLAFLRALNTWRVFGTGWSRRVAEVRRAAMAMAAGTPDIAAMPAPANDGKGVVPLPAGAQRASTGAVVAGGGVIAQQAHEAALSSTVVAAIVMLTIGAALTVWALWHWRQRRLQQAV